MVVPCLELDSGIKEKCKESLLTFNRCNKKKLSPLYEQPLSTHSNIIQFEKCIYFLEKAGKKYISSNFRICENDYEIIFKLLVYFYKDKANANKYNLNLNKEILLTGAIGCGKTSFMILFRFMRAPENQYIVKTTRDISLEFIEQGFSIINKYSKASFRQVGGKLVPKTYCFDDIGVESNIKYFGNDTNIMEVILLSKYDVFIIQRMLTHATSNLLASEIEEQYGKRIRSRLRQAMNVIAFDSNAEDKRK